jgi:hypothetical protein
MLKDNKGNFNPLGGGYRGSSGTIRNLNKIDNLNNANNK